MLTPTEESGLREILNDFSDSGLLSLADTVTKRLLNIRDRSAAIQAILSCLEKPSDLLKRQKVTKKILFSYLLKIKPFVSPDSTKAELVQECLREWCSKEQCRNSDYENNSNANNVQQTLSTMGTQFAQWFFPIYNELQGFGPEHFWTDCRLIGELKTGSDRVNATIVGANEVVNFLASLIVNDKFYFDANTSEDSVTSEQDPHGLVRILISGVVHQMSNCIGLFDSFFGLVRNPAYNDNWKIKWIEMKIHVTGCNPGVPLPAGQIPRIC